MVSAFTSFWGTLGIGLTAGAPILRSLGLASLTMTLSVIALWLRSPLSKGIPILYPGKIEAARIQELTEDGMVYNPNDKR